MTRGRIAATYGRFSGIHQVAPVCTPPNTCFLGPTRVRPQTASRLVQPFFHSSPQSVPILYNGSHLPPLKIPPSHKGVNSHLNMVPWAHQSPQPKRHLDRFSLFPGFASVTDRQTDIPCYSLYNSRLHLRTYVVLQCGLIIPKTDLRVNVQLNCL